MLISLIREKFSGKPKQWKHSSGFRKANSSFSNTHPMFLYIFLVSCLHLCAICRNGGGGGSRMACIRGGGFERAALRFGHLGSFRHSSTQMRALSQPRLMETSIKGGSPIQSFSFIVQLIISLFFEHIMMSSLGFLRVSCSLGTAIFAGLHGHVPHIFTCLCLSLLDLIPL